MKIQIIGYSGSGKSTFAKRLSNIFNINVLHIDTLHFGPNWIEREDKIVEEEIRSFMNQENWIIDGQYTRLAPERFDQCDILFFFNFNRFKALYGVLKRHFIYRNKQRDSIAEGCIERLHWSFIKWVLKDGRSKKIKKRNIMYQEKYHDKIIIFKNRRQVNNYLLKLGFKGSLKYN